MTREQEEAIMHYMEKDIRKLYIKQIDFLRDKTRYNKSTVEQNIAYMDASSASKKFFATKPEELLKKYLKEIELVSKQLGNSNLTTKQKILNFMEYIRLTGMYENIPMSEFEEERLRRN